MNANIQYNVSVERQLECEARENMCVRPHLENKNGANIDVLTTSSLQNSLKLDINKKPAIPPLPNSKNPC